MRDIKTFVCLFTEIQQKVKEFLKQENANLIDIKLEKEYSSPSLYGLIVIYEKINDENLLLEVKNNLEKGFVEKVDLSCDYKVLGRS